MRLRLWLAAAVLASASMLAPARAQITLADAPDDPVVARVDGAPIRLSEVLAAREGLSDEAKAMPREVLLSLLIDQLISQRALTDAARKAGLAEDTDVARQIREATDQILANALIGREVAGKVTDAALRARYDAGVAQQAGEPEVHARHILVATESDARAVIAALKGGADFEALAREKSTGPGAAQGGDLGFFRKGDMVPEFAAAAFALTEPGQITETPVHTAFGWHVIQLVERRTVAPPAFEEAKEELRQQMLREAVREAVSKYRDAATVERFNLDGTPLRR